MDEPTTPSEQPAVPVLIVVDGQTYLVVGQQTGDQVTQQVRDALRDGTSLELSVVPRGDAFTDATIGTLFLGAGRLGSIAVVTDAHEGGHPTAD